VFGWATTASLLVAALLSPVLGAIADYARVKKRLFAVFFGIGVLANAGLFWVDAGDWRLACWLFGLVNLGAAGSFVFYDAMLSTVARDDEMDRLSTTAYAVGYLGGGLCLAFVLLLVQDPQWFGLGPREAAGNLPARIGFLVVAVWWLVFTIPFFRRVPEPPLSLERDERAGENPARVAVQRLGETFGALRQYKHAFLFLLAFLAFNDGIGTVIRMATLLGKQRSVPEIVMMVCILLVQFVGIPFALLFGRLAGAIGPKRAILIALAVREPRPQAQVGRVLRPVLDPGEVRRRARAAGLQPRADDGTRDPLDGRLLRARGRAARLRRRGRGPPRGQRGRAAARARLSPAPG
jgi:UMF1 family MFS transporter